MQLRRVFWALHNALSPRAKRRRASAPLDLSRNEARVVAQRKRGTNIGRKVRLLGTIDAINPHLVTIGDCCVIGREAALLAHCPIRGAGPCRLGNYVYLAWGVLVLPGVTIGDYCVIGAGAVVTKNVPPRSIVAGNPARVLRDLTEAEISRLKHVMDNDLPFGDVYPAH